MLHPISGVFPLSLVSPNGETAPIEVKATHKMENVKKRLQKQGSLPDVDPNFLRMVFNGQEIGDRECCMDHDIPENAVIFVNPKKFRLPVRKPDGTTFELEVDPSYSVAKVQRGLQEACPGMYMHMCMPCPCKCLQTCIHTCLHTCLYACLHTCRCVYLQTFRLTSSSSSRTDRQSWAGHAPAPCRSPLCRQDQH